jgi:hypothetical protein
VARDFTAPFSRSQLGLAVVGARTSFDGRSQRGPAHIGRIYEVVTDSHANYRAVLTVCKPCLPETPATKPSAAIAAVVTIVRSSSRSRTNRFWVQATKQWRTSLTVGTDLG